MESEFNVERPHEALDMKCPAELYAASTRRYDGLPELTYPFHDRDILVTACGRLCLHRKRINISTVLAGQRLGIKEVDDGIWLVSFMHYDLARPDWRTSRRLAGLPETHHPLGGRRHQAREIHPRALDVHWSRHPVWA